MENILKGIKVAERLTEDVRERATALREKNIIPKLTIVRVGEDASDMAYERGALKRSEKALVDVDVLALPKEITSEQLLAEITRLNNDELVHGILIFRPLPSHIDDELIRNKISVSKDVDGISDLSMAGIYSQRKDIFAPCTARACIELLKEYEISLEGKRVAVLGRSLVIGKPVSMLALKENATVTTCHSKSKDLPKILKEADIIISAVGKLGAVSFDMVREGQWIIDVGINVDDKGNLKGDVDFDSVSEIVAGITPVPGGVGSVTSSVLMDHVVRAAEKNL